MDFMPPEKTVIPPEGGWKEQCYYIVEASFASTNPVHRYIFYTGFLNRNGEPSSYNEIFGTEDFSNIASIYYLKAVDYLGYEHIHEGATKGCKPDDTFGCDIP